MNKNTFTPSRWVWLSCLQKSIRRNHVELALRAAHHLHGNEPANLLRRLKLIAVEDVAADLTLVHRVLTTTDTSLPTLASIVTDLCGAVKDRSACDLAEAVAAKLDHPLVREAQQRIKHRCTSSANPLAQEVATLGWQATKEPLVFLIPMIAERVNGLMWIPDTFTNLPFIHGLPSETFDKYTREGCSAYRRVLKHHPTLRAQLASFNPTGKLDDLLGYAMFAVESARLDRRLTYTGSDDVLMLGQQADICRFGIAPAHVPAVMEVVAEALPVIHQARCEVLNFTPHNPSLWEVKY